jgi:hypothetical protein
MFFHNFNGLAIVNTKKKEEQTGACLGGAFIDRNDNHQGPNNWTMMQL